MPGGKGELEKAAGRAQSGGDAAQGGAAESGTLG